MVEPVHTKQNDIVKPQCGDPSDLAQRLDDVIATGGHIRAAAAFLESQGAIVASAICAGRADDSPSIVDAFAVHTDTLESTVMPPSRAEDALNVCLATENTATYSIRDS